MPVGVGGDGPLESAVVPAQALFTGGCRNVGRFCCECGIGQTGIRLQAVMHGANALGLGGGGKRRLFFGLAKLAG